MFSISTQEVAPELPCINDDVAGAGACLTPDNPIADGVLAGDRPVSGVRPGALSLASSVFVGGVDVPVTVSRELE
jgi:hypothetical protein